MKQSLFAVFCILLLAACSAYNHVQSYEENGLKTMRLIQPLKGSLVKEDADSSGKSALKIKAIYRYDDKTRERPVVTLNLAKESKGNTMPDTSLFILLDGETVPVFPLKGQYIIPENLWVSILHSQDIQYQMKTYQEVLVLRLNEKQKNQLIEFLKKAIRLRDDTFPAVPRGQKKW